ncbi:MAG: hypothetical protein RSD30_15845 [Flavobacterium sp.]
MELLFIYIILYLGIVPFIVLLFKKKAFNFKEPIVPFIWVTAIASVYEIVSPEIFDVISALSYWFQTLPFLEIVGLYFYFSGIFKKKYKKTINLLLVTSLIVYCFSFTLWENNHTSLQSHSINKSFITICVIIGCFSWFRNMVKNLEVESLWKLPDFYFMSSILIYYSSTVLLFSLGSFIYTGGELYKYWWINILATLVLRILLTIGTWKMKSK